MAKTSLMCGAPHPVKPGLFCALTYGHTNAHHETPEEVWTRDACGAPHPDPERAETCERPRGHLNEHVGGLVDWSIDSAPQFKPGDRVSAEGIVREVGAQPGSTALVVFEGAEHKPLTLFPDRLTLVEPTPCPALFPGRENEDPPPRCIFDDGHALRDLPLHESAEGWRWGTIEQRTDDAHAPAEPRCKHYRGSLLPGIVTQRCWGMAGHIGPHRSPLGEWT